MKRDFSAMPTRASSIGAEIESKKLLQDEQVRIAALHYSYLLYYISGGNESVIASPADKVREEDQDLRGWFTEHYGENYLTLLTSDSECALDTSTRVADIIQQFTDNPYGYILRTGAVNEYHIGRIVSNATKVNKHRTEARKYAKDLAELCTKSLLTGEPPNNNVFDILHSSIRLWYRMKGIPMQLDMEEHLAKLNLYTEATEYENPNYTSRSYLLYILFAVFDMWKDTRSETTWVTDANLQNDFNDIDGIPHNKIRKHMTYYDKFKNQASTLKKAKSEAESKGWNVAPTLDEATKTIIANQHMVASIHGDKITPEDTSKFSKAYLYTKTNLAVYAAAKDLAIGAELPRDLELVTNRQPPNIMNPYVIRNTNTSWSNYDKYTKIVEDLSVAQYNMDAHQQALKDARLTEKTYLDFFNTPARDIYNLFKGVALQEGETINDRPARFLVYVYNTVKAHLGLNFIPIFYEDRARQIRYPLQAFLIPAMPNMQTPNQVNTVNISKIVAFYGKALLGVSPTAYWTNNLSCRLIYREVPATSSAPMKTNVYLYKANMKTGGVGADNTHIAQIQGDKNNAATIVSAYLPDVPVYTPGTNFQLNSQLDDAYLDRIKDDPTLTQWLRSSNKSIFNYAYIINSSWDPYRTITRYNSASFQATFPTRDSQTTLTRSDASHIDWMLSTRLAKQQFKGVTTFMPNLQTLKHSPAGKGKLNDPIFFEGQGALSATEMTCVAFPKTTTEKIIEFMKTVPNKISELLNKATNIPNSGWYEFENAVTPNTLYGDMATLQAAWPEYINENGNFDVGAFINHMEHMRSFLFNRTESLFISDPAGAVRKAYDELKKNKPWVASYDEGLNLFLGYNDGQASYDNYMKWHPQAIEAQISKAYTLESLGPHYSDYMALLGAIAYFNSYAMLTDTGGVRNYPDWAKPFKGLIDGIVNSVLMGGSPQVIYRTQINDTEDVSNMHRSLRSLGTFEGMAEMPVFDVEEFHVKWKAIGEEVYPLTDNPFNSDGLPFVPVGGLKAGAFKRLSGGYGDVFYEAIMATCVIRPVITHRSSNKYMYSSVRIPVSTRGVSSKTYGLRPGTAYDFSTATSPTARVFSSGTGLTYGKMAIPATLVFAGVLGVAMFKNLDNPGAFSDKRFKMDDS